MLAGGTRRSPQKYSRGSGRVPNHLVSSLNLILSPGVHPLPLYPAISDSSLSEGAPPCVGPQSPGNDPEPCRETAFTFFFLIYLQFNDFSLFSYAFILLSHYFDDFPLGFRVFICFYWYFHDFPMFFFSGNYVCFFKIFIVFQYFCVFSMFYL